MPDNDTKPKPAVPTQNARRVKYGLNVIASVLLALVLVALLNWLGFRRVQPFDFTSTRQYTMSKQTIAVLNNLSEDYQVVTILSNSAFSNPLQVDRARDLVDEYGRYSKHLVVEHISPGNDVTRQAEFYKKIRERYAKELKPIDDAMARIKPTLSDARADAAALKEPLNKLIQNPKLPEGRLKNDILTIAQFIGRLDGDFDALDKSLEKSAKEPLPDSNSYIENIKSVLTTLSDKLYGVAISSFNPYAGSDQTDPSVRESLLQIIAIMKRSRESMKAPLDILRELKPPTEYSALRDQLAQPSVVVLISPDKVRVIQLDEMFRDAKAAHRTKQATEAESERAFVGEELITGALASLELKQQPMVVFVYSGRIPAVGPGPEPSEYSQHYEQIAQRLKKLNFRIEQWTPGMRMGPMGQPQPPQPEPTPEPGQKVTWVILPVEQPNPMSQMPSLAPKIGELLASKLEKGDSAFVILDMDPSAKFGTTDPILQSLATYGLKPQTDRIILKQVAQSDRQNRTTNLNQITEWPAELPVSQAVDGMPTVSLQSMPIQLSEVKDVKVSPLVWVTGQDMWAEKNFTGSLENLKVDPSTASDKFIIAAAAQARNGRLIVLTDPGWGTDYAVAMGQLGPGTADLTGAMFPGNSEFFVNSMYWLSGLDQLIAASARSQDIRRIEPMTPSHFQMVKLLTLGGLPLAALVVGVSVWSIRRRG